MARIPYANEWTLDYTLQNSAGVAVQPDTISLAVTDPTGAAVTLTNSPSWDAGTSTTIITLEAGDILAARFGERLTFTWAGTYSGTSFTDVEYVDVERQNDLGNLISVAEGALAIQAGGTASPDMEDVAMLVAAASAAVQGETGRRWLVGERTEAQVLVPRGTVIFPDGLVSVTSIADPDGQAVTASTTAPGLRSGDFLRYIDLGAVYRYVTVTGVWGWATLPEDVAQAARICVREWYKRDFATPVTVALDLGADYRPQAMPVQARYLLRPYRRVS